MSSSKSSATTMPDVGGYHPVMNVKNNKDVQELGKFAVTEYDKEHQADLVFIEVVEAQSQVVAGVNYRLLIEALRGDDLVKFYKAVVYERLCEKVRILESFVSVFP